MKKLYIVTVFALCAVVSAEAGKCRSGQCGTPKKTTLFKPTPRPVVTAPVAAWTAPKLGRGAEGLAKITMDITASIADLEAKLGTYRAQRQKLIDAGVSTASIGELNEKIKAAEQELAKLKKIQSCAK